MLKIAITISVTLHLIFFINIHIYTDEKQQSSFGNGKVILLENMTDQPTTVLNNSTDTLATIKSGRPLSPSKIKSLKLNSDHNSDHSSKLSNTFNTIDVKNTGIKNQTEKSTSNKGITIDQSGIELTAQQLYRQLVTQHLLTKIKNSRSNGKATVHLNIMKIGIATHVKIELLAGPKSYKTWLKQQVLNANPFPVIPKSMNVTHVKLAIQVSHETEK
ncbi:MAG: hypothetical protein ACJASH_002330 [Bermanella sp.]|jgi:hypothetical protein